jgi:DNA-directed RNA polymerase subunit M/transcription elongation factor TFIIS
MNAPVTPKREKVRALLEGVLGDAAMARNLETNVYNRVVETSFRDHNILPYWENPAFDRFYGMRARSMLYNLRDPRNPELLQKAKSGEIKLNKLGRMTHMEMFPSMWEPVLEKVAKIRMKKEVARASEVEGVFPCRSCKSKKTVYVQLQTRSADEPMTTFVTCLDCDRMYKFN